jgi:hypothetical protein
VAERPTAGHDIALHRHALLAEPRGRAREVLAPDRQAHVIHPGRGGACLAVAQREEIDQVASRPELDEPHRLVHVVEAEAEDAGVEALGLALVADPQDDVVELEDLQRRRIGVCIHR